MAFFSLKGQTALITGSTRGIGAAIAKRFAEAGARVILNARSESSSYESVLNDVKEFSPESFVQIFDVSKPEEVDAGIQEAVKKAEKIDICVCNAGISKEALILRASAEHFQEVIQTNLIGSSQVIRAISRPMMKNRYGRIIALSSVIGEIGNKGQAAYAASKAGLVALVKSTAQELASRAVTCNAIAPGFIKTEMTSSLSEEVQSYYLSRIPLARLAEAEEVASVAHFLASPEAGYITGTTIDINGGLLMR